MASRKACFVGAGPGPKLKWVPSGDQPPSTVWGGAVGAVFEDEVARGDAGPVAWRARKLEALHDGREERLGGVLWGREVEYGRCVALDEGGTQADGAFFDRRVVVGGPVRGADERIDERAVVRGRAFGFEVQGDRDHRVAEDESWDHAVGQGVVGGSGRCRVHECSVAPRCPRPTNALHRTPCVCSPGLEAR